MPESKLKVGWAVKINRKDGSWFFAVGPLGVVTPLWNLARKRYAERWAKELRKSGFNAKLIKVQWGEPNMI